MAPIERVAHALCKVHGDSLSEDVIERAIIEAKAVLSAIHEPSEGMLDKGYDALFEAYEEGGPGSGAATTWQAMLDAALNERP